MACHCYQEGTVWVTSECEEHSWAPVRLQRHEWGGRQDNLFCYYCGYPKDHEVHRVQLSTVTFAKGAYGTMEGQIDNLTGKKHDGGKPPIALISSAFIFEVAKVLEFGADKYDAWNWKGGFKWVRISNAVLRHIFSWLGGEDKDPETGLSHLAHAACGLMFLIDFEVNHLGEDDRWKQSK